MLHKVGFGLSGNSRRDFLKYSLAAALAPVRGKAGVCTVLRYPYVQNVRRTRVTIRWTTAEPGVGAVTYVRDGGTTARSVPAVTREYASSETGMSQTYYRHQAVITGLQPGTDYRYQIAFEDQPVLQSEELIFRTSGVNSFQFLAIGDTGTGSSEQMRIAERMRLETARFVVHTGDLCYPDGTFENLERKYFDPYRAMMQTTPFFPCPGNHDYYSTGALPYLAVHDLPVEEVRESDHGRYFSFDWNNAHFISLDTNMPIERASRGTGDMLNWFRADLAKSKQFWNVVYFHHPPYAAGPNDRDANTTLARQYLVPIIDEFAVPVVLSGHEHSYQRSHPIRRGTTDENGTVYITTGGGGAHLYPVNAGRFVAKGASLHHYMRATVEGYRMKLQAISIDGNEIDSVTVAPKPVLSEQAVLDAASYSPALAAGGLISIFGKCLAAIDKTAAKAPLPSELSSLTVSIDGNPIPLLMVTAQQVNAQIPFGLQGSASLQLTTPNGSCETTIYVSEFAPAIFERAVFHEDGTQVSADAPASAGEPLAVYATGLGPLAADVPAGTASPSSVATLATVDVNLGGTTVTSHSAGLAPNAVGLYKVSFRVPDSASPGNLYAFISVAGRRSNWVPLSIR